MKTIIMFAVFVLSLQNQIFKIGNGSAEAGSCDYGKEHTAKGIP
jgi:hypothetical protein